MRLPRARFLIAPVVLCVGAAGALAIASNAPVVPDAHAACETVPNVAFGAKNQTKNVTITNCSQVARADIVDVSDNNEAEFSLAKTCIGANLAKEGEAGDSCVEQVTFRGNCACPKSTATLRVEANPGGKVATSTLTGC